MLPSALLAPPPGSPRETEPRGSLREMVGWGREKWRQIVIFKYNTRLQPSVLWPLRNRQQEGRVKLSGPRDFPESAGSFGLVSRAKSREGQRPAMICSYF